MIFDICGQNEMVSFRQNNYTFKMKKTTLFLGLFSLLFTAFSQNSPTERQLIEKTIETYFDGWATGDTTKLGRAMHTSCHLKNYREDKFIEFTKSQYLNLFKPRERTKNLSTRIVSVDVTNNMGAAKVEISTEKDLFTDYFNLMKTNEGWFITDKVSTRKPHFLDFSQSVNTSTESERDLIEKTLQLYIDGQATGDSVKVGKAMHASSQLKVFRDGKFNEIPKNDYLKGWTLHEKYATFRASIIDIDVTNNMGSAKVEIGNSRNLFTDYFTLMKTNEGWFIADKVSTFSPYRVYDQKLEKETILEGLKRPWSMAFISENEVLVSQKEGDLVRVDLTKKDKIKIQNFPTDLEDSLGSFGDNTGKFEVLIDPDFKTNKFVYLSYAAKSAKGRTTKIIRAKLENDALRDVKTLFVAEPFSFERYHYGGGMTFGADGKLYFTIGERLFTEKDEPVIPIAQNIEDKRGKIYRINSDGTIPNDNPDFGKNAPAGLYAMGIRASQALAVEPLTQKIWFSEHGTQQGDEINILNPKANYGWPMKTTGKYRFAEFAPKPIEGNVYTDPVWSWMHTVAPTGLVFYMGTEFPLWKNDLLVGGLSRGSLWRLRIDGEKIVGSEELLVNDRVRIRKVAQSPQGRLFILTDEVNGKLIRIKNVPVLK
jgi:aldose sugar dehydrogenase